MRAKPRRRAEPHLRGTGLMVLPAMPIPRDRRDRPRPRSLALCLPSSGVHALMPPDSRHRARPGTSSELPCQMRRSRQSANDALNMRTRRIAFHRVHGERRDRLSHPAASSLRSSKT